MPKQPLSQQKTSATIVELRIWTRRLLVYLAGLFLLALGVAFSIKSDLGVSPINTVPFVLSEVIPLSALNVGVMTAIVNTTYVLLQFLLLGKSMPRINFLQIICGVTFGLFVNLALRLLAFDVPAGMLSRLGLLGISIICLGFGTMLYLTTDFIPKPSEGIMLAIERKSGWKLSSIKTGFDCTLVALSLIVSLTFTGQVLGVGIGTLITALTVGGVLGIMKKICYAQTRAFCFGETLSKIA